MSFYLWDLLVCVVLIGLLLALPYAQDNTDSAALAGFFSLIAAAIVVMVGLLAAFVRLLI